MQYYVKEQLDKKAILIAADGYPLQTFDNVDDAVAACIVECRTAPLWIEWNFQSTKGEKTQSILRDVLANDCLSRLMTRKAYRVIPARDNWPTLAAAF